MKLQRIPLMLATALLLGVGAKAQQIDLGARAGISIPKLSAGGSSTNPLNEGYSSRLGPDFAVFAEFHFSKLFSIQPMIEYSAQGGQKNGFQAFPTPDKVVPVFTAQGLTPPTYLYADFKSTAKINYLMVPILAKFGWNLGKSPLRLYVDAGPFVGFLLSAKQEVRGTSVWYLDPGKTQPLILDPSHPTTPTPVNMDSDNDIKDQLNKVNFGISGNVGLAYLFGKSKIFIEGGGNYGFLNIQKGEANGKNNIGAGTVALGYAYRIK
ncbi:porin family protein [Chitinophaga sp. Cy-1792]|uniref:porin family protein n=1 Tax=Chitinophaga sp. Cy-1792 TaxID=2608339 RepID=UPI00142482D9|nr:porin family protein [Chitinophaga sp. Cy-1792]NIG54203.1 PorT family protein [Chitinophaga sp. Cy-1792]